MQWSRQRKSARLQPGRKGCDQGQEGCQEGREGSREGQERSREEGREGKKGKLGKTEEGIGRTKENTQAENGGKARDVE